MTDFCFLEFFIYKTIPNKLNFFRLFTYNIFRKYNYLFLYIIITSKLTEVFKNYDESAEDTSSWEREDTFKNEDFSSMNCLFNFL